MQPPPPGFPQWGGSPDDPREHNEPGSGGRPADPEYPPAGPGQQPAYGPPPWGAYGAPIPIPAPTSQQKIGWITFAIVGLLGLLGAVLTLTLWINLDSAVHRAVEMCDHLSGEFSSPCRKRIPVIPDMLLVCVFLIIGASLATTGGAVMLFLRKHLGQFLILGGGIVMLLLAIGCEARFGATSRVTYDLIAGVVVAAIGGLMFVPAFRILLGLPPKLTAGPGPRPYGPPRPPPQQW